MSTELPPEKRAGWLEGPEGEKWSRDHHREVHAGESHLPNHIASVRPAPGEDPFWDWVAYPASGIRNPQQDPSGRPPKFRQGRSSR